MTEKNLGRLFGKESVWGTDYLPCSNRKNTQKGVLWEILNNSEYERYIPSVSYYRQSYRDFCNAYYDSYPRKIEPPKFYTCVPYWGSSYWKSDKKIAIFAQRSLNRNGAGVPLYFPLCEVDSWEKAFELGLRLNEEQRRKPFGWQSFMSVWIAMRYIFSKKIEHLQNVYYSDIEKVNDRERNKRVLEDELKIIKPEFTILFGKTSFEAYKGLFSHGKLEYIFFPCGQGTLYADEKSVKQLVKCKDELSKWLDN